ncbi:SAM-dependent methyltransferase [Streptomyces sp. NPDC003032]
MDNQPRTRPYPSGDAVGGFYDQMGAFFATLFGDNIHFGIWDGDQDWSMLAAQTRLTDRLIDILQLQEGDYLLDVGCGTGHPALRLAERTQARVLGVSVSPSQVQSAVGNARRAGLASRLEFARADAMALPYAAATFDAAWAVEMLFHVPDRLKVLREIHRTVKPGGRVVLTDFVEQQPLTGKEWDLLSQGFAFSSLLRPEEYGDVISRSGLEVLKVHDVTAATRPNMRWIESRYEADRKRLAEHYGSDFGDQMDRLLPVGMSIYTEKLGYVIAEARRPIDG